MNGCVLVNLQNTDKTNICINYGLFIQRSLRINHGLFIQGSLYYVNLLYQRRVLHKVLKRDL